VRAANPDEARKKVASAAVEFAPLGTPLMSPWYDDAFATCVMDTSRTDVPDDVVIRAKGRAVP
jgi:hypothetical protein